MNKTKKQNLPINYSIDKDFKSDKFIKLRMRICHDGINYNNSKFTIENLEEKKDSLANSPILAYMYFDEMVIRNLENTILKLKKTKYTTVKLKLYIPKRQLVLFQRQIILKLSMRMASTIFMLTDIYGRNIPIIAKIFSIVMMK